MFALATRCICLPFQRFFLGASERDRDHLSAPIYPPLPRAYQARVNLAPVRGCRDIYGRRVAQGARRRWKLASSPARLPGHQLAFIGANLSSQTRGVVETRSVPLNCTPVLIKRPRTAISRALPLSLSPSLPSRANIIFQKVVFAESSLAGLRFNAFRDRIPSS
jgi:hypothetical protein